jgi:hypothetical protein
MPSSDDDLKKNNDGSGNGTGSGTIFASAPILKLPPFWTQAPEAWFIQAEAQFRISRVTSDEKKFSHVVASLPQEIILKVLDVIKAVPEDDTKYETLRGKLIERLSMSEEKRLQQILYQEQMGDRSPSEFYRHLEQIAGTTVISEKIRMKLFTDRLPSPIDSTVIQLQSQGSDVFLKVADVLWEKKQIQVPPVNSIENKRISELEAKISELQTRLANQSTPKFSRSRSHSKSFRPRSHSRSKTPATDVCWYHEIYGKEARKCRKPCKFHKDKSEN